MERTQTDGLRGGQNKSSPKSNDPRKRLARFQQLYDRLLHTVQKSQSLHDDSVALEAVRTSVQRLTAVLRDESRSPAPHLSLSFAASNQLYLNIARIAISAHNEPIIREAVAFFGALIDSEEEGFLENERFAQCLMSFVDRISGTGNIFVGPDTEVEIVETLFGIAAKIRLQPEILPIWFHQRNTQSVLLQKEKQKEEQGFAGLTQKQDFPLCYQLIDHVHHGGRIGDFARTGLLYIFESASKSEDLEQWLVDSDIPTLMATGLGALYSQMSRKLSIVHPKDDRPIVLLLSDYPDARPAPDAESVFSDAFTTHMATFLSYLQFWQDVLEHCHSSEVRRSLLDHFRVLFLQQLLYPSLLESSDTDGGSSVAVMTYLGRILDALDNAQMKHLLLQYLLAAAKDTNGELETPPSPKLLRKRQSLDLLAQIDGANDRMGPSLFSLVDLITSSLRSANAETTVAALRLIATILGRNHAYAIGSLMRVTPAHSTETRRTHGALNAELQAYLDLAKSLHGEGLDDSYDCSIKDASRMLELHTCSAQILKLDELGFIPKRRMPASVAHPPDPVKHHLDAEVGVFRYLAELVETFLTNNTEVNLALTETIMVIASCGQLQLEGWLSVEPARYVFSDSKADLASSVASLPSIAAPPDGEVEAEASSKAAFAVNHARRRPNWYRKHNPRLLAALHKVHAEIESIRSSTPNLDTLFSARRQAFQLHDEITDAIANAPPPIPAKDIATPLSQSATPSRAPPTAKKTPSFAARMFSDYERSISSPSARDRSQSPSKAPATPRATQSRSPPTTPRGKDQRALGSNGLAGSRMPQTPQRALSPRPDPGIPDPTQILHDVVREANSDILTRRFTFPVKGAEEVTPNDGTEFEGKGQVPTPDNPMREATLSHILTNAVILRDFELELVALMQVRASMFDEVKFA